MVGLLFPEACPCGLYNNIRASYMGFFLTDRYCSSAVPCTRIWVWKHKLLYHNLQIYEMQRLVEAFRYFDVFSELSN